MNRQIGFLVDLNKCIGCRSCEMACQNEQRLGAASHRRVTSLADKQENVFAFLSMSCNHCLNPACIAACPNKCFKKRRDGIVVHNPLKCNACASCIGSCPFGAPHFNPGTGKIAKCNFCMERLAKKLKPACVAACITEALQTIDLSGPQNKNFAKVLPNLKMAYFTNPAVRFIIPQPTTCYWRN